MKYSQSVCALNLHEEFVVLKDLVDSGVNNIHLDFMDFKLTNSFGLRIEEVKNLVKHFPNANFDAHLMCKDIEKIIKTLAKIGIKIFFVNVLEYKKINVSNLEKELGIEISVYLESKDKVQNIEILLKKKQNIMIMTIDKIGGTGQPLNDKLLDKCLQIKKLKPEIKVWSDGGLRQHNASFFSKKNVDFTVGGSIIRSWGDKKEFKNWFGKQ